MKTNIMIVGAIIALAVASLLGAQMSGLIRLKIPHFSHSATACADEHKHAPDEACGTVTKSVEHSDRVLVELTPGQRKLVSISISEVQYKHIGNILRLNGEIHLNMDRTARLMPRLPGFVTAIKAGEGDKVESGQLLASLTSHKLGEYYSDLNSAMELEELASSEFERAEKLKQSSAISDKEHMRYRREHADAVIARRRAEALLKSLLIDPAHSGHSHPKELKNFICTTYEIRAPFPGTVIGRNLTVGENLPADDMNAVFTVSDLRELWLDLQADSAELKQLRPGMRVQIPSPGSETVHHAVITYVAPLIDETTRTGLVRALLDNHDGSLRPGEFVTGLVSIDSDAATLLVPRHAVQLLHGEMVVFAPEGDAFTPRQVRTGKAADGMISILSGLKEHDRYVSEGAFELKSILLTSGMDPHAGCSH